MKLYCNSLYHYSRFETREIRVGSIGIGGMNPIRIQSMTTTNTMDTKASIAQSVRMIEAGAELVRLTAPSTKEAENLKHIKKGIRDLGFVTPIVADIHFTPNAALIAAKFVEKVRINPGNYADRKQFKTIEYTDQSYSEELERIRARFVPLIQVCKQYGTALRIGTNHGSLSDRILSRYGDTPLGMVESALEFTRICVDENFHEIVFSMKASNTHVMIQAYRLLVSKMMENGMNYPLHLGVTEAGEGEDGRIKSALGIGTLLEDGLGDTIRVSLTEEPEYELPVARAIVNRIEKRLFPVSSIENIELPYNPYFYIRRNTKPINNIGGNHVPIVIADLSLTGPITLDMLNNLGFYYNSINDKWTLSDLAPDYLYIGNQQIDIHLPNSIGIIKNGSQEFIDGSYFPLFESISDIPTHKIDKNQNFLIINENDDLTKLESLNDSFVFILSPESNYAFTEMRSLAIKLMSMKMNHPIILSHKSTSLSSEELQCTLATNLGGLLIDGMGDGVMTFGDNRFTEIIPILFGTLQAARVRISKTEYISCPSCGRTLFDLQTVTARIREKTSHLKGVKIGIMGCIVNGPGEMADADYGYVGTGNGKITLYKGQEKVQLNIPAKSAVDSLIQLIKDHGDWTNPKA
ncbi:MAG: (E)-4-hydroxy-3-methylbut-2-enyl-diphosphate synthase [Candidatus Marinimicrobia bacterium]|nr:(E)-4-hydroxy-3-methylbut-2-enyl-diphosphate synthase [Candidatus Neomarinimicrobiota bacterium]